MPNFPACVRVVFKNTVDFPGGAFDSVPSLVSHGSNVVILCDVVPRTLLRNIRGLLMGNIMATWEQRPK